MKRSLVLSTDDIIVRVVDLKDGMLNIDLESDQKKNFGVILLVLNHDVGVETQMEENNYRRKFKVDTEKEIEKDDSIVRYFNW